MICGKSRKLLKIAVNSWVPQILMVTSGSSHTASKLIQSRVISPHSSLTDLYTGFWWSPSHVDLCSFKVSVLVPLEWRHQMLSCFGFPTYPHTSRMCSPLVMWPKSNNIGAFALDLKTAYEGEHTIFGLLSLANLLQNDVLQFHPFTCRFHSSSWLNKIPLSHTLSIWASLRIGINSLS
jgi:hypothetical protein